MSREGFPRADIDTGLFADPKIVALARRLRDPIQTATHVALYEALVLGSWGASDRITLGDAAPAWWLEPVDDIAVNLHAVGLVDDEQRIPEHAWDAWFGPAWQRRENRKESGKLGGQRSWDKRRRSIAEPTLNPATRTNQPSVLPPSSAEAALTRDADGRGAAALVCGECDQPVALATAERVGKPGDYRYVHRGQCPTAVAA